MADIGEGAPTMIEKMETSDEERAPSSTNWTSDEENGTEEELYEVEKIIGMSKASVSTNFFVQGYCLGRTGKLSAIAMCPKQTYPIFQIFKWKVSNKVWKNMYG